MLAKASKSVLRSILRAKDEDEKKRKKQGMSRVFIYFQIRKDRQNLGTIHSLPSEEHLRSIIEDYFGSISIIYLVVNSIGVVFRDACSSFHLRSQLLNWALLAFRFNLVLALMLVC